MSKYGATKASIKDVNELIDALGDCGFSRDKIEYHEKPRNLVDFHGHFTKYLDGQTYDTAEVIIRRQYIGGLANDIGFKRQTDGTFSMISSAYDRSCGYNDTWLKKIEVSYAQRHTVNTAKKQGFKLAGTKIENGKRKLLFVRG